MRRHPSSESVSVWTWSGSSMAGIQLCHVVLRVKNLLDLHGRAFESPLQLGAVAMTYLVIPANPSLSTPASVYGLLRGKEIVLSGGTALGGNRDAAGADDHTAGAE